MRKTLFKNSFFSFLKNKLVLSLVIIIVFITSAIYTMMESTASSFNRSYNEVTVKGRLHDFTIKESFDVTGNSGLKAKIDESIPTKTLMIGNKTSQRVDSNLEDIYFDSTDTEEILKLKNKQTGEEFNVAMKLKLSDYYNAGTTDPKNIKNLTSGLKVKFLLKAGVDKNYFKENISNNISQPLKLSINNYGTLKGGVFSNPIIIKLDQNNNYTTNISNHGFNDVYSFINFNKTTLANIKINLIKTFKINALAGQSNTVKFYIKYNPDPNKKTEALGIPFAKAYKTFNKDAFEKAIDIKNNKIVISYPIGIKPPVTQFSTVLGRMKKINANITQQVISENKGNYIKNLRSEWKDKLNFDRVNSLSVASENRKFKLINVSRKVTNGRQTEMRKVDKLMIFEGNNLDEPYSDAQMMNGLYSAYKIAKQSGELSQFQKYDWIISKDQTIDKYSKYVSKTKFFSYFNNFNNLTATPVSYVDPTSYEAVISFSYAKRHLLSLLSPLFVKNLVSSNLFQKNPNAVYQKYYNSIIWVDSTPYFAIGTGTTPDFSFPIIDGSNPLPNDKTEALLFVNNSGYARITDAFRANPTENYIAAKFKNGVNKKEQDQIIAKIENDARNIMSWPNNIRIVSKTNDTSEKVILAPQRIAFLQKLNQSISTISYLTTTLLILFVAFIIIIIVKKHINSERKTIGILIANGYSKAEIAWSMTSIGLIVGLFPCVFGYITGYFLQFVFINVFDNYWTLPIGANSFSWISMLLTAIVPIIGIVFLTLIITLLELRGKIINIINQGSTNKSSWISIRVLNVFKYINIKNKISISLFLSNITKMIMTLVVFAITIISGTIALSLFGKYDRAINQTAQVQDYGYKIDLYSPTKEGGAFSALSLAQLGARGTTSSSEMYKFMNDDSVKNKYSYINILPKEIDDFNKLLAGLNGEGKDADKFLKNVVQFKSLLDITYQNTNAWSIAKALMPENQKNIANRKYQIFMKFALNDPANKQKYGLNKDLKKYGWWSLLENKIFSKNEDISIVLNQDDLETYFQFIGNTMQKIISNYKTDHTTEIPYFLSYKNILVDDNDELYSSLNISYVNKNRVGKKILTETNITGINSDSKMIKLGHENINALKKAKSSETEVPVVINQFFKELYNLSVGDTVLMDLKNKNNRKFINAKNSKIKVKVVGVVNSYNGSKIYTLRDYANVALGWKGIKTDTAFNGKDNKIFNGVYTTNKSPLIFRSLALYSPSGLYVTKVSLAANDIKQAWLDNIQKNNKTIITGSNFLKAYGSTPYLLATTNVNSANASDYTFKTMLNLSGKLIWIIESIALIVALCFVLIISSMIISDNRKFISTTRVMGYRRREISRMFLLAFIPSIIIAIMIAIPVTILLLTAIKVIIMNFGNVLIPLNTEIWAAIIAIGLTITIFVGVYLMAMRHLKGDTMLNAFK